MAENIRTQTLRVADMTCVNCERKIEKKLKEAPGVIDAKASFADGDVRVTYIADVIDAGAMERIIEDLDYHIAKNERQNGVFDGLTQFIGIAVVLYGLYAIFDRFDLLNVFYDFPEAKAGMSYGMLFVVGLLTSVHCIGMCGGINLSLSLSGSKPSPFIPRALAEYFGKNSATRYAVIRSGLLYNLGRIVSYTLIGGAVGALGAAVSPTENFTSAVQLAAGVFMIIMGLNMLNVFPWLRRFTPRMPKFLAVFAYTTRAAQSNGPLYVGLLNGFMPCGPLQAMQLYALSTGSFIKGVLSMFMFSVGTLPLMFGLSALSSILSKKFTRGMMMAGATMVIVMGVAMLGNGMYLAGLMRKDADIDSAANQVQVSIQQGNVQLVRTELHPRRYATITVQVGVPVRWTINVEPGTLNGCNNRFVIPEYNRLQKRLSLGENIVEFTPTRTGTFTYSCWMNMIHGKITVVEEDAGNVIVAASTLSSAPVSNEGNGEMQEWIAVEEVGLYGALFTSLPSEKIFATVGTLEIRKSDVEQVIKNLGPQGAAYNNARGRKALVGELVNSRLFSLSGAKQGLDKSAEFKSALENFITRTLAQAAIEKILQDIVVKEEEIRKFYDDNTAQFSSMSYDAAKPRITQYLTGEMRKQKYQEALAALKTEYIVEVLTPDTTDAAED